MSSTMLRKGDSDSDERGVGLWETDAWRDRAVTWLDDQLTKSEIVRTGPVEQTRVRPWSTILTAPTTPGTVWLKAAAAATGFEVALYPLLHHVTPTDVLAPIATDVSRGCIVLPDGGAHLGELLEDVDLVEAMIQVLPRYGAFQRSLMPHTDEMIALGVPDMRPAILPQRLDEALVGIRRTSICMAAGLTS